MSSFKNASKSKAKAHRERSQPESRAKFGILEKKKDYKRRANEYHKKQGLIKSLKKKALERNPDEFYFNMVHTQKVDGIHQKKASGEEETTEDQLKLMYSQDQRYVDMKRTSELRKIERLRSSLHMIDSEEKPKNKHIVFVDSKKEARQFDAAKYFNTHPSLVDRVYNRPRLESLASGELASLDQETNLKSVAEEKAQQYKILKKRMEREKQLAIISQKMATRKHLMDKTVKKKKVAKETKTSAAQFKWKFQRKR